MDYKMSDEGEDSAFSEPGHEEVDEEGHSEESGEFNPDSPSDASATEEVEPKPNPGWGALLVLLGVIWLFEITTQVITGIVVTVFSLMQDTDPFDIIMTPMFVIPLTLSSWAFAICFCTGFMRYLYGTKFVELFSFRKVERKALYEAIAISATGIFIMLFAGQYMEESDTVIENLMIETDDAGNPVGLALPMLLFAILIPPVEEMYYRGFLFPAFRGLIGTTAAFILIVVWFGGIHAFQLWGEWLGLGIVMYMGAMWTWLRYRYDSIVPGIVSHTLYNGALILFSVLAFEIGV